jgi:hypothetical protein
MTHRFQEKLGPEGAHNYHSLKGPTIGQIRKRAWRRHTNGWVRLMTRFYRDGLRMGSGEINGEPHR